MSQKSRGKNPVVAASDLSRLVRDHYSRHFQRRGEQEEFDRLLGAAWADLLEAGQYGGDPGFLLHVLVCTKFQRVVPDITRSKTLQELSPRKRAALVGGLRALRQLGLEGFKEIFGPQAEKWAEDVWGGIEFVYQELTGGTVTTPAFQMGSRARLTRRQAERPLTACIVCLMEEFRGRYPKPAAAAAVLLGKFGLLRQRRGEVTAIEFVKKRWRRASPHVLDRLGPIGNRVWLLRQSYMDLKAFLAPPPPIPDRSPIWAEKGKAWRVKAPTFSRAFRRFCRLHGLRATLKSLEDFERALHQTRELEGPKGLRRVFDKA